MNRTTLSLIAAVTALAAVTGFAAATTPGEDDTSGNAAAARLPVERSSLLCPEPSQSDLAETAYTSYTPETKGTEGSGTAELMPAKGGKKGKAVVTPKKPGTPVAGDATGAEAPALTGTADGPSRPAGPSSRPPA